MESINEVLEEEYIIEAGRENRVGLSDIYLSKPNSQEEITKLIKDKLIFYNPFTCKEGLRKKPYT